jgi:predicted negative regulator of RcsB-dependent stress response
MTIWAPVVAALGASILTGIFGFGGILWQQHRASQAAAAQEKSAAYHQLIARSLSFSARVRTAVS